MRQTLTIFLCIAFLMCCLSACAPTGNSRSDSAGESNAISVQPSADPEISVGETQSNNSETSTNSADNSRDVSKPSESSESAGTESRQTDPASHAPDPQESSNDKADEHPETSPGQEKSQADPQESSEPSPVSEEPSDDPGLSDEPTPVSDPEPSRGDITINSNGDIELPEVP